MHILFRTEGKVSKLVARGEINQRANTSCFYFHAPANKVHPPDFCFLFTPYSMWQNLQLSLGSTILSGVESPEVLTAQVER
jgi:hypothetical protein